MDSDDGSPLRQGSAEHVVEFERRVLEAALSELAPWVGVGSALTILSQHAQIGVSSVLGLPVTLPENVTEPSLRHRLVTALDQTGATGAVEASEVSAVRLVEAAKTLGLRVAEPHNRSDQIDREAHGHAMRGQMLHEIRAALAGLLSFDVGGCEGNPAQFFAARHIEFAQESGRSAQFKCEIMRARRTLLKTKTHLCMMRKANDYALKPRIYFGVVDCRVIVCYVGPHPDKHATVKVEIDDLEC